MLRCFINVLLISFVVAGATNRIFPAKQPKIRPTHVVRYHEASKKLMLMTHSEAKGNALLGGTPVIDIVLRHRLAEVGWDYLELDRDPHCPYANDSSMIWYTAGFAEGNLMQTRIFQHYSNVIGSRNASLSPAVVQWITTHISYMEKQADVHSPDPFWKQVGKVLTQLRGVSDGYSSTAPPSQQLNFYDLFLLNFMYEIGDVQTAVYDQSPRWSETFHYGGCSAFIKPTAFDLYMGHNTWSGYNTMLRVYKVYSFADEFSVAFSSYPGLLHSGDDWYMLSTGLTVQETTSEVFSTSPFEFVIPQSVSEFIRVIVANNLATEGHDWHTHFCRMNSGTYNNQWMVVNMNLYHPGTPAANLPNGLLWVSEQLGGMCDVKDVTEVVRTQGYWASYNKPFFADMRQVTGANDMERAYGSLFSYHKYARAAIFAREAPDTKDLRGLQRLLRYNKYQTDPLSRCPTTGCNPDYNPMLTIASRGDLVPANGTWGNLTQFLAGPGPWGAIDAKIASFLMLQNFTSWMISGPTYDDQVPFDWSRAPAAVNTTSHLGQPDVQIFPWINSNDLRNGY